MVCFGVRSRDCSYAVHADMLKARFEKDETIKVMPGRIEKVGDDLWLVQFNLLFAQPLGVINALMVTAFFATWALRTFSLTLCILTAVVTTALVLKNYLWFGVFYLAAKKKYGVTSMKYVDQEDVLIEVFDQWDKAKSMNGLRSSV
jgi:hypothetical protein